MEQISQIHLFSFHLCIKKYLVHLIHHLIQKLIQLGYNRLPGFQNIKNNDIVVFNFPVDTLIENIPFDKKMNYVKDV